jgi:hypothetical protein
MLHVKAHELRVFDVHTRIPFRYGIATMRDCPHMFVKLTIEIDGQRHTGVAADHLPPKWFTKNPQTPFADDLRDMIDVIRHAADRAVMAGAVPDVYSLVSRVYAAQGVWGRAKRFPPLLYNFGVSLVERAAIEAFCKAKKTNFATAARENLLRVRFAGPPDEHLMLDYDELEGTAPGQWLPKQPLDRIIARHTVGLLDYLTDEEIPAAERVSDGLPQSLDAAIRSYGLKHFKLKLAGDVEKDAARLKRIAAIIEKNVRGEWAHSLDGNENYHQLGPFRKLWESLTREPQLKAFLSRLIFAEQPLHRDVALSDGVKNEMADWPDRPPLLIDESDGEPGAVLRALECGYVGTSHKNCKGIIKGIAGAALLEKRRRDNPGKTFILSGEDLSNIGPVALLQDLAAVATLGVESVERNGHHYFKGVSMHAPEVQNALLAAHPDLYRRHQTGGFATLDVKGGTIDVRSVTKAPLGVGFELDVSRFTPLDQWKFAG